MSTFITRCVGKKFPKPVGPYSAANIVNHNGFKAIYTSGIIGFELNEPKLISECIEEQTRTSLTYLKNLLEENDATLKDVVKVLIFVVDLNDFARVNKVYSEFFTDNFPSRSCVQVAKLPKDAKIEIEAVAYKLEKNTKI